MGLEPFILSTYRVKPAYHDAMIYDLAKSSIDLMVSHFVDRKTFWKGVCFKTE